MTVAAVIVSATSAGAVESLEGVARVRHAVDAAWSGGAMPVIVVAPDPDGSVASALDGSPAMLVPEALPGGGPAGRVTAGVEAAVVAVGDTTAALIWPAPMAWVDAGTVTALIEAHGSRREAILRPSWAGTPGWPALVPLGAMAALQAHPPADDPTGLLEDLAGAGVETWLIDLGDPGVVLDVSTPRSALPGFQGPSEPVAGHPPEWGADLATTTGER
jgi:CTP:molybdopterin cytidylyltransferase MocA